MEWFLFFLLSNLKSYKLVYLQLFMKEIFTYRSPPPLEIFDNINCPLTRVEKLKAIDKGPISYFKGCVFESRDRHDQRVELSTAGCEYW